MKKILENSTSSLLSAITEVNRENSPGMKRLVIIGGPLLCCDRAQSKWLHKIINSPLTCCCYCSVQLSTSQQLCLQLAVWVHIYFSGEWVRCRIVVNGSQHGPHALKMQALGRRPCSRVRSVLEERERKEEEKTVWWKELQSRVG